MREATGNRRGTAGLWHSIARATDVLRRIIGVPDYERYVAHLEACHPGTTPMSRQEFFKQDWDKRYSQPGSRCC